MLIRFLEQFGLDYEESVRRRPVELKLSVWDGQTDYQFGQECIYEPCYYQANPTKVCAQGVCAAPRCARKGVCCTTGCMCEGRKSPMRNRLKRQSEQDGES